MKIAVLIKSVPDTASVLSLAEDNRSILSDALNYIMNPYDEYALEEAVRLKEASADAEIMVVSLGDENTRKVIRSALAMGADRAIFVATPLPSSLTARGVSHVLATVMAGIDPDIIFAGKQAVDDDAAQVAERVAELLDMPHVSAVSRFILSDRKIEVDRQAEGGYYTMELTCPALLTMDKGLNAPRYPTLPNILKAKKKEIREMTATELALDAVDLTPGIEVKALLQPRQQRQRKIFAGAAHQQVKELATELCRFL